MSEGTCCQAGASRVPSCWPLETHRLETADGLWKSKDSPSSSSSSPVWQVRSCALSPGHRRSYSTCPAAKPGENKDTPQPRCARP